jgi:two-component system sensor histidine kinase KdpD
MKTLTHSKAGPGGPAQYGIAAAAVSAVSTAAFLFSGTVGYQTVSLLLLLTVAVLSLGLSIGPVLTAAALSALIWNFFFIPPSFTFAIGQPQDALMFAAYFIVAAITGILTTRIRAKEKHATALFSLTKDLIAAKTQDEAVLVAVQSLGASFDAGITVYLASSDGEMDPAPHRFSTFIPDPGELRVAAWVYWNERAAGKFVDLLPETQCTYYPISGPRYPLGVIGVKNNHQKPFSVEQESLLLNFIAQIASTLEREQLNELAKRTVVYAESEKLYSTLFNSISHELRTPIAAIVGATEGLSHETHLQDHVEEIRTAVDRLNRLVENLLDMTRLESGQLAPKMDWCDVNDLFRAPVQKLKQELAQHTVVMTVPDDIPLIKLDFVLMDQVLTNLLYNAAVYTPPGSTITLSASVDRGQCIFTVSDTGPGIPASSLGSLFQKFYRVPGSRAGGTGLGLSIVKGFVEAHKGTITVRNIIPHGTEFTITIPTETHSQHE